MPAIAAVATAGCRRPPGCLRRVRVSRDGKPKQPFSVTTVMSEPKVSKDLGLLPASSVSSLIAGAVGHHAAARPSAGRDAASGRAAAGRLAGACISSVLVILTPGRAAVLAHDLIVAALLCRSSGDGGAPGSAGAANAQAGEGGAVSTPLPASCPGDQPAPRSPREGLSPDGCRWGPSITCGRASSRSCSPPSAPPGGG